MTGDDDFEDKTAPETFDSEAPPEMFDPQSIKEHQITVMALMLVACIA